MRFYPLAVASVLASLGTTTINAFIVPNPHNDISSSSSNRRCINSSRRRRSLLKGSNTRIAKSTRLFLAEGIEGSSTIWISEEGSNSAGSKGSPKGGKSKASSSSQPPPKTKKLSRTQQRILELEQDIDAANQARLQLEQEIVETDLQRNKLETEISKKVREAELQKQQLVKLQARGRGGGAGGLGSLSSGLAPVAGATAALGGIAAVRQVLLERQEKLEEERRLEEERIAQEQAAAAAKAQSAQASKYLLPILGAGAAIGAGLGFVNNDSTSTTTDATTEKQQSPPKKKPAPAKKAAAPIAPENVELPYLDKQIAKAEKKRTRAEQKVKAKQANVQKEAEVLANLESKLTGANAGDLPALARAEEKLKEEQLALKQAEAERQAAAEAEKKAAEEKAKAEAEKQAVEAEKKAAQEKADRLAAEQRAAEEKAAKAAEEASKQKKQAELEMLKKEQAKMEQKGTPKVPAVSQFISGKQKPTEVKDKGLANLFNFDLGKVVVGGVALAGLAVAAAVIAAEDDPVVSTYKVTGKSPEEYLNTGTTKTETAGGGDDDDDDLDLDPNAPAPRATIRVPKKDEKQKGPSLPSQLNNNSAAAVTSKPLPTDTPPAASEPISMAKIMSDSSGGAASAAPPRKKSYSPFGSKPRAATGDPMSAGISTFSSPPPASESTSFSPPQQPQTNLPTGMTTASGPPQPVKKSFSPFGRKPVAAGSDSLYAPGNAAASFSDPVPATNEPPRMEPIPAAPMPDLPAMDVSMVGVSPVNGGNGAAAQSSPKKSYSPFGSKPKAASSDSLYSAPTFAEWDDEPTQPSSPDAPAMPFAATSLEELADDRIDTPPTVESYQDMPTSRPPMTPAFDSGAKKSYSPFGSKPQAPGSGTGGGYLDGM